MTPGETSPRSAAHHARFAPEHDDAADPGDLRRERASRTVLLLTLITMTAELIVGYAAGSMALVADGWHMSSHATAMFLAFAVHRAARSKRLKARLAFGPAKLRALGGYTSALMLGGFALLMLFQSVERMFRPVPVDFDAAIGVAVVGLLVNLLSIRILGHDHAGGRRHEHEHGHEHGHEHEQDHPHEHAPSAPGSGHDDQNHRAAYLHVFADAVTSVAAIVALLGGRLFGWRILDPLMGVAGGLLVLWWAIGLVRISARTLIDVGPGEAFKAKIRDAVRGTAADATIVDLHVWETRPDRLACHVSVVTHENAEPAAFKAALAAVPGLGHVTVEVNVCRDPHP